MENLEAQDKIINLGKLFVHELNLEPGVDTFSRWMAHYLAEKIHFAEQSEGVEKEVAEKQCFDVIIKLWKHRHSLPSGRRPFQGFEPIFDTLLQLSPDVEKPFFYKDSPHQDLAEIEINTFDHTSTSVEDWMNIVEDIDKTARIWIEFALTKAAKISKNETTKEWIENAKVLSENEDSDVIQILLENISFETENYEGEGFSKKYDIEKVKKRISELQKYSIINDTLLKAYQSELEKIKIQ